MKKHYWVKRETVIEILISAIITAFLIAALMYLDSCTIKSTQSLTIKKAKPCVTKK